MQLMPWINGRQETSPRAITLRDAMNQLFDESFWEPMRLFREHGPLAVPGVDIAETDQELQIAADLPGYDPKDVAVRLEGDSLVIEGRMEQEKEEKGKTWHRRETTQGNFYRRLTLPSGIQEKDIACRLKNGKLTVTIQKREIGTATSKTLPIQSS